MIKYKRKEFLNNNEKNFFHNLESIIKGKYYIFSKVKILDLVSVEGLESEDLWKLPVWTKHVDFIICDKNIDPVLSIELNGLEHKTEYKSIKGGFAKENIFKAINLPFIAVENEKITDLSYIKEILAKYLNHLD